VPPRLQSSYPETVPVITNAPSPATVMFFFSTFAYEPDWKPSIGTDVPAPQALGVSPAAVTGPIVAITSATPPRAMATAMPVFCQRMRAPFVEGSCQPAFPGTLSQRHPGKRLAAHPEVASRQAVGLGASEHSHVRLLRGRFLIEKGIAHG
jgi:hypothetical protein